MYIIYKKKYHTYTHTHTHAYTSIIILIINNDRYKNVWKVLRVVRIMFSYINTIFIGIVCERQCQNANILRVYEYYYITTRLS